MTLKCHGFLYKDLRGSSAHATWLINSYQDKNKVKNKIAIIPKKNTDKKKNSKTKYIVKIFLAVKTCSLFIKVQTLEVFAKKSGLKDSWMIYDNFYAIAECKQHRKQPTAIS